MNYVNKVLINNGSNGNRIYKVTNTLDNAVLSSNLVICYEKDNPTEYYANR
jgi:hypothetical protein